jgi:hypothetical protein
MRLPRIRIAPGEELIVGGKRRRILQVHATGTVLLVCPLTREEFTTSMPELLHQVQRHVDALAASAVHEDADPRYQRRYKVSEQQYEIGARRLAYVLAAVQLGHVGPASPQLRRCIEEVASRSSDSTPPAPWSVYRWLCKYRRSNNDAEVLRRDTHWVRRRAPKISEATKETLRTHLNELLKTHVDESVYALTDLALALTARDLGFVSFRDKHGREQIATDYVAVAEARLRNGHAVNRAIAR